MKKKQPVKPPELILILIHGQKVNTMTLPWMRTIDLRNMTAQIMIVMQTWLNIVRKKQERREEVRGKKKQELHLKLPLLNIQGHICGSDR